MKSQASKQNRHNAYAQRKRDKAAARFNDHQTRYNAHVNAIAEVKPRKAKMQHSGSLAYWSKVARLLAEVDAGAIRLIPHKGVGLWTRGNQRGYEQRMLTRLYNQRLIDPAWNGERETIATLTRMGTQLLNRFNVTRRAAVVGSIGQAEWRAA